jgi:CMP-N,N'-diacetyllegionaminic acid synthase
MEINDVLFIIPARGGSKGLPKKNILPVAGRPLIYYTIDAARDVTSDRNICVSTDNDEIIRQVTNYELAVPFKRPDSLAADQASTWDVVRHAIDFYEKNGRLFKLICILQPTSPLRNSNHIKEALKLWNADTDMIVSVKKSKSVSVLCQENSDGFIELIFNKKGKQRQEISNFYEYNGAIYIFESNNFMKNGADGFKKVTKYVMIETDSIDIDTELDLEFAQFLLRKNKKGGE